MSPLGKRIAYASMMVVGGLSLSACATEDYVNKQVAVVADRVTALEGHVQQVEATANAANQTAQAAASAAQNANQRLDQLTSRVDTIEQQLAKKPARN